MGLAFIYFWPRSLLEEWVSRRRYWLVLGGTGSVGGLPILLAIMRPGQLKNNIFRIANGYEGVGL